MIQVKSNVFVEDKSLTDHDWEIEEPTVVVYRDITMRTATAGPLLVMTIPQTKQFINDLMNALEDLGPYTTEG